MLTETVGENDVLFYLTIFGLYIHETVWKMKIFTSPIICQRVEYNNYIEAQYRKLKENELDLGNQ